MIPSVDSEVKYERRDVKASPLMIVALAGAVALAVILLITGALYRYFRMQEERADPLPSVLLTQESKQPPGPRLQVNSNVDTQTLRLQESTRINGYGWIDRKNSIVRIPIDRAMEQILETGLPEWKEKSEKVPEAKP